MNDQIWGATRKPEAKAQSQPAYPDAHLGAEPRGAGSTLALGAAGGLVSRVAGAGQGKGL